MLAKLVTAMLVGSDAARDPAKRSLALPIVVLGVALTLPVLALLLAILRGLTIHNPLTREPVLGFAVDAAIGAIILAAELIRRSRKSIDAQWATFATFDASAQARFRVRWLLVALLVAVALQLLASAVIWK